MDLQEILELHKKWLNNEKGGKRADLSCADLSCANLRGANLRGANLSDASLRNANLRNANLSYANLSDADLSYANLSYANLSDANLSDASLRNANLRNANLSYANLRNANLSYANLSSAKNLANANSADYILAHFDKTQEGIIVYKTFGEYNPPNPSWEIEKGSIIEENVNANRTNACGSGVNVGTLEWVKLRSGHNKDIWKCLIKWEWMADVVVPYHTDGKIRAGRVQLIEIVK